ncbi:MAG: PEP/pyruvate-binding domain-containing protein [Haloarculaceae archaeon]
MTPTVVPFAASLATDPTVSGGKGASLATLRRHGVPIPDGVVVTTATYRAVIDDPAVSTRMADLEDAVTAGDEARIGTAAGALREAIRSRPLPETVTAALADQAGEGSWAVRSSATAEDLPEASFAGQHDTHLDVRGERALCRAVSDCLASLFTDRAVAYRARNNLPATGVEMAVVVQRFVEPDASGILFTADPLTGRRSVAVIDAGPGRGDTQVSGRATAETFRYDRDSGVVLEYRAGADGRTLSDDDAAALVAVCERIESLFGRPQDVEWALRDGSVSILQSRPITALFPVPTPAPDDGRTHVYYSFGHRQGMTDAMPPLVLDVWRAFTNRLAAASGLRGRLGVTAGGRLYVDLTPYLSHPRLRDRVVANFETIDQPGGRALRSLLEERPGDFPLRERSLAGAARSMRAVGRALPFARALLGSLPRALMGSDPDHVAERLRETYRSETERALAAIREGPTVAARLDRARSELFDSMDWLLEPFYAPFLAALVAGRALRRLLPNHRVRVEELALGAEDDAVYRMTLALGDLADEARASPGLAAALRSGATLADLREREDTDRFLESFDAFLGEYGFRAVGEIDWSRPRYREDPRPLLNVVAGTLETGEEGAHRRQARALTARADAAERALHRAANPAVRPLVRRLTRVYRGGVGIREHPKFALSPLLAELRSQTLAAADSLVDAGALPERSDVWLLSFEELRNGLEDDRSLAGIDWAARRREHERNARLAAPRILTSDGEVPRPSAASEGAETRFAGTGAAPGVVVGTVRVVTDPGQTVLKRGEVLVARYTDPGWTPLFLNAAGIVTEVGGRLTHGSLVAREYGIPAVVAVDGATTHLQTGDRVRVDGTNGVVERLE